ncbi:MAG: hypothetical protein V3T58_06650 [Candidatus Hydrothermarchaeales archaeon]
MQKNEIKAEMDIVKMSIQSLIAFFFALLLLAAQQRVSPIGVYIAISAVGLAGLVLLIRKYKYLGRELDIIAGGGDE